MTDTDRWLATQRAANAAVALIKQRKMLAKLEEEYERRVVAMELAGVPKTRVCAELVATVKAEHELDVRPGDGFSSWSIRQILDSGRHRS